MSGETVTYTYDALNRLATATSSVNPGWGQSFAYDGFGNLTTVSVTKGAAPSLSTSYSATTNRRSTDCADANGNLYSCGYHAGYDYDVANRLIRDQGDYQTDDMWEFAYSPANQRVLRTNWSGGSQVVDELTYWGANGQKLAAYDLYVHQTNPETAPELRATQTGTFYYFGGKMVKNAGGWVTPDRLGSNGKYFPYGDERPSATSNGKEKFATYFRDSETGLDYAQNRYHDPGDGRFLTPDPYMASGGPSDPGSWNRYAYVGGDPINRGDPSGLCWIEGKQYADGGSDCPNITSTTVFSGGGDSSMTILRGEQIRGLLDIGWAGDIPESFFIENCASGMGYCPWAYDLPPEPACPPGQIVYSYGCDVPLNYMAETVRFQMMQMNPAGFVNAAGVMVATNAAMMNAVAIVTTAMTPGTVVGETIVLGRNPAYLNLAEQIGADAFQMSTEAWKALGDRAAQWAVNQAFLDGAITSRSTIYLASEVSEAVPGTFFYDEIIYLLSRGYTISADGLQMIAPFIPIP